MLQHLPETQASREAAIDLKFACRSSLLPLGELDRILDHLRDAEALAQGLADQRRLGWVSAYMTIHFSMIAQNEQGLASGRRAVASPRPWEMPRSKSWPATTWVKPSAEPATIALQRID